MQEVVEKKTADRLQDLFWAKYKERYGVAPILDDSNDLYIFRWVLTKLGEDFAAKVIETYILMDGYDNWFVKMNHSLPVMRKNINQITTVVAKAGKSQFLKKHAMVCLPSTYCDHCELKTEIVCKPNQVVDWTFVCSGCRKKGLVPRFYGNDEAISFKEWKKRVLAGTNRAILGKQFHKYLESLGEIVAK